MLHFSFIVLNCSISVYDPLGDMPDRFVQDALVQTTALSVAGALCLATTSTGTYWGTFGGTFGGTFAASHVSVVSCSSRSVRKGWTCEWARKTLFKLQRTLRKNSAELFGWHLPDPQRREAFHARCCNLKKSHVMTQELHNEIFIMRTSQLDGRSAHLQLRRIWRENGLLLSS